jgi:prophage antirepressor-like protein
MLEMHKSFLPIPQRLNPTGVRIRMAGTRVHPLWCLADWCQMLGYTDAPGAVCDWVVRLDDEELVCIVPPKKQSRGQFKNHEKWYIGESEVFMVIRGCELAAAEPFQEWLASEVLPSIDEYGYYPPPSVQQAAYQRWLAWFDACFLRHYESVCQQKPGGFSVLSAIKAPLIAAAEELIRQGLPVEFDDRPDLRVEAWWKHHRKRKGLRAGTLKASLELPEQRGTVYVTVYGPEELDAFKGWFAREYLPAAFPSLFADDKASQRP